MSDQNLVGIFAGAENAKALGGRTPRLPIGSHTLLLSQFGVKESQMGKGRRVEASFLVVDSTSANAREQKGWVWFIGSPGLAGQYEESRLQSFLQTVASSIGDTSPIAVIGAGLAGSAQLGRGLVFKCVVSAQTNKDGSPKMSPKNEIYTEISWSVVPQGAEDIKAGRAILDGAAPAPTASAVAAIAPAAPAPAPAAAPAAPAATGGGMAGLLAGLAKK